jgi:hypothetical protein
MKNRSVLIVISVFILCVGFVFGYFFQSREIAKKDLMIANTAGNNISEMNRLYSLLNTHGFDARKEQIKYNLDMLTIVDCGVFVRNISSSTAGEDAKYLIKGIQDALRVLESNNVHRENLVLCDGKVLGLLEAK